ncbi:MAG TPA: VWA domain-containing protein [Trueperaceae bacterium]|nr:VWA domain-containing protein [Trueperaceae bacterium]
MDDGVSLVVAGVALGRPLALLGLLLCVVPFASRQIRVGSWLRAGAIAALVVALAQPTVPGEGGNLAVLVDVSDSVGDTALAAVAALDASFDNPELYLTASETARVTALPATAPGFLRGTTTDLARALQVASSGGPNRVLLVSDGVTSEAALLSALPDVPVDVLWVPSRSGVRLAELLLPDLATPGQQIEALAVVESDVATTVTVRATSGGVDLEPIVAAVRPGTTALPFRFTAPDAATVAVSVTLETQAEVAGSTRLQGEVSIRTRPPLLVVDDPALARVLGAQGLSVVDGTVADITSPLSYSAVVVRGSAAQFTPGQLDLLRAFVDNGGGLMMTGGPESFGFGAWYRTPVEEILPVTTDLRTEVSLPLVALVMVVDRSQSMATGAPSKIELAKEGAIQVVELAYQDDLLGLMVFSDVASTRWVFELRPATERGKREMLQGILGIGTSGGTVLGPAYEQSIAALEATQAAVKHIIVLSDGRLYDGGGPFASSQATGPDFAAMAAQGLTNSITTSTIAIGQEADFERLREIAEAGGGRYYEALDVATLPRIFTNEALTATRALLIDEPTVPVARPNQLLSFPSGLPPVDAYIATTLKSDAQEVLAGRDGEPLLAIRRVGLGRTAALTTDLNAWAGEFGAWEGLPGALGTLGRWLQAVPSSYDATVSRDGNELVVVVDAVRGGEYVNNERLSARFAGTSVELDQVAPGRYTGRLPWRDEAGREVVVSSGSEVVARSAVAGPDPEFAAVDGAALLATVAQRTGGTVVSGPEYQPPANGTRMPLWPFAVGAALLLFLVELAWRRLGRAATAA